ncbi:TM2 domain-containing protein [Aneurinibacillus uraniidurans]|uniref:TM2 domain-containing protein n=1 Tax=Aneurinibacillus uraniidurans TaxID=2966586 RepID=UPI0023497892|nr:TM2 domain-containing protein [Aneurinibacillus sp. B1]WCN37914.1 TM2 domain-containing protein [Aneurinibacillus sp. B1]
MNNTFSKKDLTLEELGILESEMLKKRKNKEAAWGLWAGLSFFGAHRFYTENYGYASAMLLTSALPIVVIILLSLTTDLTGFSNFLFFFSVFLLIGSVIWSWIDALFLNRRVEQLNDAIECEIIHKIKSDR